VLQRRLGQTVVCLQRHCAWWGRQAAWQHWLLLLLLLHLRHRAELVCKADRLAFAVNDGIPVMLESEARKLEPTEDVD
jgi:uncharacterized protein YbaR (Trm112 family)